MRPSERLQHQRAAILELAARHHAARLRVFGSVLHGNDRDDSDIDLLADFEPGSTLFDVFALQEALEALLECKVDLATPNGLHARIRDAVLSEARAL